MVPCFMNFGYQTMTKLPKKDNLEEYALYFQLSVTSAQHNDVVSVQSSREQVLFLVQSFNFCTWSKKNKSVTHGAGKFTELAMRNQVIEASALKNIYIYGTGISFFTKLFTLDGICKAKCHSNYTTPDFCPWVCYPKYVKRYLLLEFTENITLVSFFLYFTFFWCQNCASQSVASPPPLLKLLFYCELLS